VTAVFYEVLERRAGKIYLIYFLLLIILTRHIKSNYFTANANRVQQTRRGTRKTTEE